MHDNWHKPKRVNLAEAHDIKLELDVRCQKLIEKILRAAFPEIPLLGEEGDSGDVTAEYRWVVDPIDGTVNYFYGMPHAAVSIALQSKSDKWQVTSDKNSRLRAAKNLITRHSSHITVLGVIYDPFTDEIWTTVRGGTDAVERKNCPRQQPLEAGRRHHRDGLFQEPGQSGKEPAAFDPPRAARQKNPHHGFGGAGTGLCRQRAAGRLHRAHHQSVGRGGRQLLVENAGGEFYALPAPSGKLRMCADNGRLRKKLQIGSLLK